MLKIRVPATSANLSVGFDTLGIALNIYNEFGFEKSSFDNVDAFESKFRTNNLVLKSYKRFFEYYNIKYIPVKILPFRIDIPSSRGLGSSASCIVAGVMAANILSSLNLKKEELLDLCASIEGHPDNVLPALVGGLCAAFMAHEKYYYKKYIPSSRLQFYSLIPPFELKTELSRSVLPKMYNRCDVIANLSRIVNLPSAFIDGDIELLKAIFDDKIHEPYRYKIIEHSLDVKTYFKDYAVAISGAGSSLLVIGDKVIELDKIYDFKIVKVIVDNNGVEIYEC